jgi:predicted ATPase/DNA-binding winged helix-turn-helix (wHTH) protein
MANLATDVAERIFTFDSFRLLRKRRLLLDNGTPVSLGSRALEILIALVERPGELVSKEELLASVWPNTHVVEGNLKFQVGALRRALGDGLEGRRYLITSAGRGYRFVAPVKIENGIAAAMLTPDPSAHQHNLPGRIAPLIGRSDLVSKLATLMPKQRLLTVTGPGGIGKTSLAIAVAERLINAYRDGVWMIELAHLSDPNLVRSAVAAVVRAEASVEDTLASLATTLHDKRMLLVLNNCAHVVDAAASVVTALLKGAPDVHIIATSREPLRVEGERLHRLEPLAQPPASVELTAEEALRYPAVQLFAERAAATGDYELHDEDVSMVGEICRRLDGIPLAIEFAAARVGFLGVKGLAAQLENSLGVLSGARRAALGQHQTMRAALDWSFDLLTAPEKSLFLRLSIFSGGFTLAAAAAVARDASHSRDEIVELVLDLATKSLIAVDVDELEPRFRLLETTRTYALEKLTEFSEREVMARRHAEYYLQLFETFARDGNNTESTSAGNALEINNLRAVLGWAFGSGGDLSVGVRLAAAAIPLWTSMSLLAESYHWVGTALNNLDTATLRGSYQEMVLQTALGASLQFVKGNMAEAHAALSRALELAGQLGDTEYRLRAIHALWIYHIRLGEVRSALALARQAEVTAASVAGPAAMATVGRMLGKSEYFAGEHDSARSRLERFLQMPSPEPRLSYVHRFGYDQCVVARYVLGHALWVRGFPDQAVRAGRMSVEEARYLRHPLTLCSALAWGASALCLRTGDLAAAQQASAELIDYAEKYSLGEYRAYGLAVRDIVSLWTGTSQVGVEQIRSALGCWRACNWHVYLTMGDFAEAVANAGYVEMIIGLVDETVERAESNQELWAFPETLRVKGELLLSRSEVDSCSAQRLFERSLDLARAQGALSWELRTAMSIARLSLMQGEREKARALLAAVYARFTEGFDSRDLKRANRLLAELEG